MQEFEVIKIESHLSPVSLQLYPHKFESYYPSFCCQVACTVQHPTGRFIYEASDIWYGTDDFERFESDLSGIVQGTHARARLRDLSDDVVLEIEQCDRKTSVCVNIFEHDAGGAAETHFDFKADTDLGLPASLLQTLRAFNKWW